MSQIATSTLANALGGFTGNRRTCRSALSGTALWYAFYWTTAGMQWATSPDAAIWTVQAAIVPGFGTVPVGDFVYGCQADVAGNIYLSGFDGINHMLQVYAGGVPAWRGTPYTVEAQDRSGPLIWDQANGILRFAGINATGSGGSGPIYVDSTVTPSTALAFGTDFTTNGTAGNSFGVERPIALEMCTAPGGVAWLMLAVDSGATPNLGLDCHGSTYTHNIASTTMQSILANVNLQPDVAACQDPAGKIMVVARIAGTGWQYSLITPNDGGASTVPAFAALPQLTDNDRSPAVMLDTNSAINLYYLRYNAAGDYGIGYLTYESGSWVPQSDVLTHNGVNRTTLGVTRDNPANKTLLDWQEGTASPYTVMAAQVATSSTALEAGGVSLSVADARDVTGTVTAATGGAAPRTQQVYWSTTSGFVAPGQGTALAGATGTGPLTFALTGLTTGVPIYVVSYVTDSATPTPATALSVQETATPTATALVTPRPVAGPSSPASLQVLETPSGGTPPYSVAFYRSATPDTVPGAPTLLTTITNVPFQGTATLTDTPPLNSIAYDYVCVVTDAASVAQTTLHLFALLKAKPLVIGMLGDSIVLGLGPGMVPALKTQGGVRDTSAINQAIGGTTSYNWLPTQPNIYSSALTAFQAAGVNLVMMMLGTNDFNIVSEPFDPAQLTNYQANIAAIAADLVAHGMDVLLNAPPAKYPNPPLTGVPGATLELSNRYYLACQANLDAVADRVHIFKGDRQAFHWFAEHPEELNDGTHPTNTGYDSLERMWASAALANYLQPSSGSSGGPVHTQL